jgi:Zn ribbon nucleic-acid-binding protein
MDFVPGDVEQDVVEIEGRPTSVQTRRILCPQCGYLPEQRWVAYSVKSYDCENCGHHGEEKQYAQGGNVGPSVDAAGNVHGAAPENVGVDRNAFAHGLGIQGIKLGD